MTSTEIPSRPLMVAYCGNTIPQIIPLSVQYPHAYAFGHITAMVDSVCSFAKHDTRSAEAKYEELYARILEIQNTIQQLHNEMLNSTRR